MYNHLFRSYNAAQVLCIIIIILYWYRYMLLLHWYRLGHARFWHGLRPLVPPVEGIRVALAPGTSALSPLVFRPSARWSLLNLGS
jgi:hypothetical protein